MMPHSGEQRSSGSRPYQASDLEGLSSKELRDLVKKQRNHWPKKPRFNVKTNKTTIRGVLLDPANGFTFTPRTSTHHLTQDPSASSTDRVSNASSGTSTAANGNTANGFSVFAVNSTVGTQIPLALADPDRRPLQLYIEDKRFIPTVRSTVEVSATVADHEGCGPGAWRVLSREVLEKLQSSIAAIRGPGPVMVGTPDETFPEYPRYFVEAPTADLIKAPTNPTHLTVAAAQTAVLFLHVAYASFSGGSGQVAPAINGFNDDSDHDDPQTSSAQASGLSPSRHPSFRPLEEAHSPQRRQKKQAERHEEMMDIAARLKTIASMRNGYTEFRRTRNRRLQNPAIPPLWRFAAQFNNDFYNKDSRILSHELSGRRITQECIISALGVKETWLREAIEGDRLVSLYGTGGELCAPAVVEEIAALRELPLGRSKLLKFLRRWHAAPLSQT